jgi:primosomal protein N' (replication factor Y)
LLQTGKNVNIQNLISQWTARVAVPPSVRVKIDIDPYSFY